MLGRLLSVLVRALPRRWTARIVAWRHSSRTIDRLARWVSGRLKRTDIVVQIAHGHGAGLRIHTRGAAAQYLAGTSEPEVQEMLALLLEPGAVCFDVGANVGFVSLIAARLVGPEGAVYAVEPHPDCVRAIAENAALNQFDQVTPLEVAASDRAGREALYLGKETAWNKLASTGHAPHVEGQLEVETVPLDQLVAGRALRPPAVIKIDVEGAEVAVLRGLRQTVARDRPLILCQSHDTNRELSEILESFGYWQLVLEAPDEPLVEAPWNANVLAGPPTRLALREIARERLASLA